MTYDITIYQGATYCLPLLWEDTEKAPINLTGRFARMQVRPDHSHSDVLIELTTENGRIQLGGADGTIVLALDSSETSAIAWAYGVYDIEVYHSSNGVDVVDKLLYGNVVVVPEVTK